MRLFSLIADNRSLLGLSVPQVSRERRPSARLAATYTLSGIGHYRHAA